MQAQDAAGRGIHVLDHQVAVDHQQAVGDVLDDRGLLLQQRALLLGHQLGRMRGGPQVGQQAQFVAEVGAVRPREQRHEQRFAGLRVGGAQVQALEAPRLRHRQAGSPRDALSRQRGHQNRGLDAGRGPGAPRHATRAEQQRAVALGDRPLDQHVPDLVEHRRHRVPCPRQPGARGEDAAADRSRRFCQGSAGGGTLAPSLGTRALIACARPAPACRRRSGRP